MQTLVTTEYTETMETVDYAAIATCDSCPALSVPVMVLCRLGQRRARSWDPSACVEIDWWLRPRS